MYVLDQRTYAFPQGRRVDAAVDPASQSEACAGARQTFLSQDGGFFMLYPQGSFYPQGAFGQQGTFGQQGAFGQQAFQGNPFQNNVGNIPFANTLYGYPQQTGYPQTGYPQQTPNFAQGLPQSSNWQHPAQHQAALQQHAVQQLLAHQLAAQQLGAQQPFGGQPPFGGQQATGMNALSNGAGQSIGSWTQQQPNIEQFNPASTPRHHLLQQLAQYHHLVAQQLAQLAAQQALQSPLNPYAGQYIPGAGQYIPGAGQFIPGQLGGNFTPGITMH
jgi:hypothetical protein